ncbi:hypothetical protein [Speluncibacter jeojiensis]|uniref:Uncharacterized protein n=1 Tax=Speluncibacter jeojiensis TaxID=2710754 RepID=A0A9X4M1G3_9ACTN|nr:hypothetical protein [Corynebacteriales bacterium D3-21]
MAMTAIAHGFEWLHLWFFWLVPVLPSIGMYFSMKKGWVAAGARWVQNREKYVEIYDLRYVEIKVSGNNQMLRMTDGSGRKIRSLSLLDAQTNPALWDLLYNGIRHSVASGKASPSRKTRNILDL